jgi:hypothetical protein
MALSVMWKHSGVTGQDRVKKRCTSMYDSQSGVGRIAVSDAVEGSRHKFQGICFNTSVIK